MAIEENYKINDKGACKEESLNFGTRKKGITST